jgi:uncharacterized membrane protein YkoI
MPSGRRLLITLATLLVVLLGGASVAVAQARNAAPVADDDAAAVDDDGSDTAITAGALDHAASAALDHVGGGRVTGTEVDDEESWYEVEVTRDDGTQVDVQLDRDFSVVGDEAERAGDN